MIKFAGEKEYDGFFVGLPDETSEHPIRKFLGYAKDEVKEDIALDSKTFSKTVLVNQNVPTLYGGGGDDPKNLPKGMKIELFQPGGTQITANNIPNNMTAFFDDSGSLTYFTIDKPAQGAWQVQVTVPENVEDANFFISTLPTGNVQKIIEETLQGKIAEEKMLRDAGFVSFKCIICNVAAWAVAGIVAGILVFGGIAALTVTSPAITGMVTLLGGLLANTTVLAIIQGFFSPFGILSVGAIVSFICLITGACTPSVSVKIKSPNKNTTVSGQVDIKTDTSGSIVAVTFFAHAVNNQQSDVVIGTITGSPFEVSWNSRNVGNGDYELYATVAGNNANGISERIKVTVNN